jgi:hypothetical protein
MEKFDGVRVYWDGKALFARNKKQKIEVPSTVQFPSTPFEGEIWMGYNTRQLAVDFVQNPIDWTNVKIIAFDAPQAIDKPYSERLNILKQSTSLLKF